MKGEMLVIAGEGVWAIAIEYGGGVPAPYKRMYYGSELLHIPVRLHSIAPFFYVMHLYYRRIQCNARMICVNPIRF